MGKKQLPVVLEHMVKKRTGLVWSCNSNVIPEAHGTLGPVANAIKIDRNGHFFVRCASCGDQHFFSREYWTASHGLSREQAQALGLTVLG